MLNKGDSVQYLLIVVRVRISGTTKSIQLEIYFLGYERKKIKRLQLQLINGIGR